MEKIDFTLCLPPQPLLDVDEMLYEIFEDIGCGDVPGSGTFGNKEGVIQHEFNIVVPNIDIMNHVVSRVVKAAVSTDGATLEIGGSGIDLMQYFRENCE